MSAFNPYQWATFIGVVILGVFFSLGLQLFFMKVVLKPEKVARAAAERVGMAGDSLDYKKLGHLGTGLQEWVGAIEIILFSSSVVAGYPQFIGIWFGTKYIAAYKTWAKEPVGRTFYNRSLFGSGLNVLLGAATGGAALLAIHHAQGRTLDLSGLGRTVSRGASMLQLISGAIIAMLVAIWVEYLRRPSLGLIVEATPHDMKYENRPAKALRGVRLKVYNKPLSGWAPWMTRSPALQCHGIISFHHPDGQNVFGRQMMGRWSNSLEPVPIPIVNPDGTQSQILDFGRLTSESRMDIYPGESELMDIAVRLDDDEECYGWNNASYFCTPLWRNPEWKLPCGRYLVKVTITSSGQKCVGVFRLINDVPRTDFRLESTTQNGKDLV